MRGHKPKSKYSIFETKKNRPQKKSYGFQSDHLGPVIKKQNQDIYRDFPCNGNFGTIMGGFWVTIDHGYERSQSEDGNFTFLNKKKKPPGKKYVRSQNAL